MLTAELQDTNLGTRGSKKETRSRGNPKGAREQVVRVFRGSWISLK